MVILGNNTIITGISNLTKYIVEQLGANTCKVSFDFEIEVIQENKNEDFYITTDYGVKKKEKVGMIKSFQFFVCL